MNFQLEVNRKGTGLLWPPGVGWALTPSCKSVDRAPGFIAGPIFWLLVKSPQLAAQPSTYLAVAEELEGVSGKYFDGLREKTAAPEAEDEEVARRLWAESARLVGLASGESLVKGQSTTK